MALNIEDFIPDTNSVEDGVWVDLDEDSKVKVAYMPPDAYQNELARRQRRIRNPNLLERADYLRGVENDLLRRHVLDWVGLKKGSKEFPFSPENLDFIIKTVPDVRSAFLRIVQDVANFRAKQQEDGEKNSPSASNGTSTSSEGGETNGGSD